MINALKKHHRKIILTAPILFLMIGGDFSPTNNGVFLRTSNYFPEVGTPFSIELKFSSNAAFNATDGAITFTESNMQVSKIDTSNTNIDLWGATPEWSNNNGIITWSGGIISPVFKNNKQEGQILKAIAVATKSAPTIISIKEASMLSANGTATNIIESAGSIKIYPRPKGTPNPDLDFDGKITSKDISQVMLGIAKKYNPKLDINNDGVVNYKDANQMIIYYSELNK